MPPANTFPPLIQWLLNDSLPMQSQFSSLRGPTRSQSSRRHGPQLYDGLRPGFLRRRRRAQPSQPSTSVRVTVQPSQPSVRAPLAPLDHLGLSQSQRLRQAAQLAQSRRRSLNIYHIDHPDALPDLPLSLRDSFRGRTALQVAPGVVIFPDPDRVQLPLPLLPLLLGSNRSGRPDTLSTQLPSPTARGLRPSSARGLSASIDSDDWDLIPDAPGTPSAPSSPRSISQPDLSSLQIVPIQQSSPFFHSSWYGWLGYLRSLSPPR